ncbi:MAG: hypothetical protein NVSMB26_29280 [Beijerinckiaceae bacterium]
MIGAMLATVIEALFMGAFVRVRQLVVVPIVRVVAGVFVVVSQCGHHGQAQQHGGRKKGFP